MTSKKATDTDRKIGVLIRKHREPSGWTLEALAEAIGITYQQLQKYESVALLLGHLANSPLTNTVVICVNCHPLNCEENNRNRESDESRNVTRTGPRVVH